MVSNTSTLIIQDDIWKGSLHLDEVLLSAIPYAESGAAAFAFATQDGLNAIFGSEEFRDFCRRGHHFDLYIGIDSITDDKTLRFAKKLAFELNGMLNVKVYYNPDRASIFHAKTTWFKNADGDGCLAFVGSGNLTRSGLQKNIEMFSWIEQDEHVFKETLSTWYGWVDSARQAGRIRDIDDSEIIARAKKNEFSTSAAASSRGEAELSDNFAASISNNAVLISKMPKQTGRGWGQFVMSKRFYTDYFGFQDTGKGDKRLHGPKRRVLLRNVDDRGNVGELESRAGNISQSSSNYRIEIEGGHSFDKNDLGTHMIVFVKIDRREYLYHICDSKSSWCMELSTFADEHKTKDLKGGPKCLVSLPLFENEFPDHPLIQALKEAKHQ